MFESAFLFSLFLFASFQFAFLACLITKQIIANNIIEVICKHGVFESIKYILETDGFSFGNCRKPFAKITEEGKVELRQVIADTYRQIE